MSLDPDLSERDRKLILKNLEKAELEVEENPISGGNFHAWKNVFNETVERMKKPFIALGLTGTLALAGCTGSIDNKPLPDPTTTTPIVEVCSTENPGPWGDSVALEEITDEFGVYCKTTIDPNSKALVYSPDNTDVDSLKEYGFTEQDVKDLLPQATRFFSEEVIDSTILDNPSEEAFNAWAETVSKNYTITGFTLSPQDGTVFSGEVPTLVRDGGPRIVSSKIAWNKAEGIADTDGNPAILFYYRATVDYRLNDAGALVFETANNQDGYSQEQLIEHYPHLTDGKENRIIVDAAYAVGYSGDGTIIGSVYEYNIIGGATYPLED